MSAPRPDLPVTKKAAKGYARWLESIPWVEAVYVGGSRSPKSDKAPRKDSDWDFQVVLTDKAPQRVVFGNPRSTGELHGDVQVKQEPTADAVPWREVLR